jgi:hypothetical protein
MCRQTRIPFAQEPKKDHQGEGCVGVERDDLAGGMAVDKGEMRVKTVLGLDAG